MQIPDEIRHLYTHPGPFATAYLDATRSVERGQREVDLRWQDHRADLERAGADNATLAAMDDTIANHRDIPGPHGQVIVASEGTLLLDATLPRPPTRPMTRWAPLPHLMPYFAQAGPQLSYVLVVTDRTGADIQTAPAKSASEGAPRDAAEHVQGSRPYPITKTSVRALGERHFQQRVENSWAENARDVAAAVSRHAVESAADIVVIAGDTRARSLLVDDLASALPQGIEVTEIEHGGRGEGASPETLDTDVHDVLLRRMWRERHEVLTHLQQNLGRGQYGVAGVREVLDAVRRSQADTVVVSDDPSSTLTAWFGREPLQVGTTAEELREMGVAEPHEDRFDAVLVRAVAASAARLVVTPNAHDYLPDGIGALLRYTDPATP